MPTHSTSRSVSTSSSTTPSNTSLIGRGIVLLLGSVVTGYMLSAVITGEFTRSLALGYILALLLPLISVPLSVVGVLPQFDLWVWYLIVLGWLASSGYYAALLKQATGSLTVEDMRQSTVSTVFASVWMVICVPVAYTVGWVLEYALDQTVGLLFLFSNPFTFPIAILTDVPGFATHGPEVWVLILLMWVLWWQGIKFISKFFKNLSFSIFSLTGNFL